jgi:hypothetical protein
MDSSAVQGLAEAEVTGSKPRPLFQAANRGTLVASIYSAALILGFEIYAKQLPRASPAHFVGLGLVGIIAGAIAGFSNTENDEDARRDLKRNAIDGLITVLWASNLILAVNLALALMPWPNSVIRLVAFAGGTLLGAVVGEPLLAAVATVSVKGRRPLLWVNAVTAHIRHPDVRFVVRVAVQSIVVGSLVALAVLTVIVIIALLVISIAFLVLAKVLGDGSGARSSPTHHDHAYEEDLAERERLAAHEREERERQDREEQAVNAQREQQRREAETQARLQGRAAAKHFDRDGHKIGWTDSDGRHFDSEGRKAGWTDSDGRHYDSEGRKAGWTDSDGQHHDSEGRKAGWTESDGRHHDRRGNKDGWDE